MSDINTVEIGNRAAKAYRLWRLGVASRLVGGLFGSWLSFAVAESASAPGQIPIGDLVAVFDTIRRARGGEML